MLIIWHYNTSLDKESVILWSSVQSANEVAQAGITFRKKKWKVLSPGQ